MSDAGKLFRRRGMPRVARILDITSKFLPTPKSGTISTIDSPAKKFVDIRTRVKKAGGYAMGGEASEGVARAGIRKGIRDRKRKELMDSLERLRQKARESSQKRNLKKILDNESRRNPEAEGLTRHDPRLTDQPV